MIEFVGKVKMNYDNYSGTDAYSDGKVEDELLDIVCNHAESEYNKIISDSESWPILYHLSNVRENIIDWFPFKEDAKVLEIGSGCGAVTGALARKCKAVTCVELSKKRSLINANRHADFDNIEILVGNFQTIEKNLDMDFDYITLIGVFEYAASYIEGDNSYEQFLDIIKKHLAPNGKLILAIENKFGLKYWAGCKEDHVGKYYESIEGYCHTKSVKTFSKKGLVKIFDKCRLAVEDFYYPYPDYKLPNAIYSDYYMPRIGDLNNNHNNLDADRILSFDETKVYDSLIEDEMYSEFANSFLVILKREEING